MSGSTVPTVNKLIKSDDILRARQVVKDIYFDEKVKEYVLDIVNATRNPNLFINA